MRGTSLDVCTRGSLWQVLKEGLLGNVQIREKEEERL